MPTTKTIKRPRPAALPKPPWPDSEKHPERLFWLATYFRALAEADALKQLSNELHARCRPLPMQFAIYGAMSNHTKNLKCALDYVVSDGLLPFAFVKTTVFDVAEVPA